MVGSAGRVGGCGELVGGRVAGEVEAVGSSGVLAGRAGLPLLGRAGLPAVGRPGPGWGALPEE
ncbi:hypothetical protein OV079_26730 [Nannocystis pusilla]|uniref:Uncharacterized protein n=1 Tax=Nannocystis pusilla TaxID=889268 RepID=A0A9X3F0G0_9BACT|nr:hypothetical protein [Nannocystis pusilla]MCY1009093.1 hypothetical protein [Nannocystis pusilla]